MQSPWEFIETKNAHARMSDAARFARLSVSMMLCISVRPARFYYRDCGTRTAMLACPIPSNLSIPSNLNIRDNDISNITITGRALRSWVSRGE
jgi:hypothetical protein